MTRKIAIRGTHIHVPDPFHPMSNWIDYPADDYMVQLFEPQHDGICINHSVPPIIICDRDHKIDTKADTIKGRVLIDVDITPNNTVIIAGTEYTRHT